MGSITSFDEIKDEFEARVRRMVWCTVATVDTAGRPRTRILHPIWEGGGDAGPTGWIATGRHSLKEKHLAANPFVSITYWDPQHQQVYAECKTSWEDDPAEKLRVWNLYKTTPPPYGYDPQMIWQTGPDDPGYGLLKLTPWRIELFGLQNVMSGAPGNIWHAAQRP
jgi:general stress protein 26